MTARTLDLDGIRTPLREAGPAGDPEAVVFVHGNPGSGADWEALLEVVAAGGRRALAWDAPGFGGSRAPAGFEQSLAGHAAFITRALEALGVRRAHLVLHDFGGLWGLRWAAGDPVAPVSVTLIGTGILPGYRGHAAARAWRTPLLGELVMAATTRAAFRRLARHEPRGLPRAFADRMYDDFDRTTRRAVLSLYRSVGDLDGEAERVAGALRPRDLPALVLWGASDRYLPAAYAERQRAVFPSAEVEVLDGSGHWPFVDAADAVADRLAGFLHRVATRRAGAHTSAP